MNQAGGNNLWQSPATRWGENRSPLSQDYSKSDETIWRTSNTNNNRFRIGNSKSPSPHHRSSAQNRLLNIRNSVSNMSGNSVFAANIAKTEDCVDCEMAEEVVASAVPNELDTTDITVQVEVPDFNKNGCVMEEPKSTTEKFKMVLDPNIQTAIKILQARVTADQSIFFPFSVKPHTTAVTTHDRFSSL